MTPHDAQPAAWTAWTPAQGWVRFDAHRALSEAIWAGLSEAGGEWHYINLVQDHSLWECRADGSAIAIQYQGERIDTLHTQPGAAEAYLRRVAEPLGVFAAASEGGLPAAKPAL